eukprot:6344707-Prymnesium_polylepis.1
MHHENFVSSPYFSRHWRVDEQQLPQRSPSPRSSPSPRARIAVTFGGTARFAEFAAKHSALCVSSDSAV